MESSVEHDVLVWGTNKLRTAFKNSLKTLGNKFADLLTPELRRDCSDSTTNNTACAEAVVASLQVRVSKDRSAYYKIIEIMKNESKVSYIAQTLEEKRDEMVREIEAQEKLKHVKELPPGNISHHSQAVDPDRFFYSWEEPPALPVAATHLNTTVPMEMVPGPIVSFPGPSFPDIYSEPAHLAAPDPIPFKVQQDLSSAQEIDTFPAPDRR